MAGNEQHVDDLEPEHTAGFKVSEQKTLDEYHQLDQHDESLRKWKENLGIGGGNSLSDASDPRRVIITTMGLVDIDNHPDIIFDLTKPGAIEDLSKHPFVIKEGSSFRFMVRFRVQHQVISGLKYIQSVSRMGLKEKKQEMIGSYSPNTSDKPEYEKKFEADTAPSGMIGRGSYKAQARFIDDDKHIHLQFEWAFDVKKDW